MLSSTSHCRELKEMPAQEKLRLRFDRPRLDLAFRLPKVEFTSESHGICAAESVNVPRLRNPRAKQNPTNGRKPIGLLVTSR
jgi:hypothetical protein